MSIDAIPSLLSGLLAIALGAFVGSRGPRRTANWAFAWGMAGLGAMELAHAIILSLRDAGIPAWPRIAFAAEALMLPGWALFSVTFSRSDAAGQLRRWRWLLGAIGGLALMGLAAIAAGPVAVPRELSEGDVLRLTGAGKALAIFGLLTAVFVLFQLESTFRHSRGTARWQIKYFILGVFGIFGMRIFALSDMLLANALLPAYLPVQSTVILFGFGLVGFGLVRHRLLDLDVFVSRHMVHQSLTVVAVGVYLLAMGVAGWVMRLLNITPNLFWTSLVIFVTAMALMIGLLSETVRHRVKRTVARHFYQNKYDYRREWTELTRKLASVVSAETIPPRILAMVVGAMGIGKAALLLSDGDGGYRLTDSVGGVPSDSVAIDRESPLAAWLARERAPLALDSVAPDDPVAGAVRPFRAEGLTLLVPLAVREEILGLLAVGPPAGAQITHEDEELLITVAGQAGSALLNARFAEQLAQARELEALNRVASFMLHDLKNCVSTLSLVTQNAETVGANPTFQRDALRAVAESARQMRVLIERLSHLPKGLELRLTAVDLNGLVSEAVGQARPATNGAVRLVTELNPLPGVSADSEQVRKVLGNLLLNAVEAVQGEGEVRVRTTAGRGSVSLEVSDTGPGIPAAILRRLFLPFQTTKPHGLGLGLFQVKSVVEAHGGRIHVASREGQGTTVRIEFPVPKP